MTWNWQQTDWPEFRWDPARITGAERQFTLESGVLLGTLRHVGPEDREHLSIEAMSTEAVTTSEIEGEILDRVSVQSSIRRQLGLTADKRRSSLPEQGIAQLMVDLHLRFADPLAASILFGWHRLLMNGRRDDLQDVGRYRQSLEPMQVVSGPSYAAKVHFEAPPSSAVPGEMKRFIEWFNRTAPCGRDSLEPLVRAGITHLYFVSLHPFEDGNGRLARALSEKALAQSLGQPTMIALAATILARRKAYYDALEAANKGNEITPWLCWFADTAVEAQRRTIAGVEFIIGKTRLLDRLRGQLNVRQEKALLRMLREGPDGFEGGLSAGNYATITGASAATATRDLGDMVAKGALVRSGERRHARYLLPLLSL